MSMQDPIADMLTRIRNAQSANHKDLTMYVSKSKIAIASVLKEQGYIEDYSIDETNKFLSINLKYYQGKGVISKISRTSKPGLRVYQGVADLKKSLGFLGGLGILIVSTSKGVMSATKAISKGLGGEVICCVT